MPRITPSGHGRWDKNNWPRETWETKLVGQFKLFRPDLLGYLFLFSNQGQCFYYPLLDGTKNWSMGQGPKHKVHVLFP